MTEYSCLEEQISVAKNHMNEVFGLIEEKCTRTVQNDWGVYFPETYPANMKRSRGVTTLHLPASTGSKEKESKESEARAADQKATDDRKKLIEAVTSRNVQDTHHWIKCLKNVNFYDPFGKTPLHRAAFLGDFEIVDLLIRAGADVNMLASSSLPQVRSRSALHEASERGEKDHRRIIQRLVQVGVNIGSKDGHKAAVHCLLDAGVDKQRDSEEDLLQLSTNIRLYQPKDQEWHVVPPKIVNPNKVTLKLHEEDQLVSDIFDFSHIEGELSPDQVCIVKLPHDQVIPDESRRLVAVASKHLIGLPTWEFFYKSLDIKPYVVAEIAQLSWFAVLSRPLTDSFSVGSSGGELTSTADPRASLKIPENTSSDMTVVLEILPVDEKTTKRAQKHEDECKIVQSAGSVVRIKVIGPEGKEEDMEPSRPMALQLPAPKLLHGESEVDENELRILQDKQDNEWWDVTEDIKHRLVNDRVKCELKKLEKAGYITTYAKDLEGLAAAFGTVFMHRYRSDVNMLIFYNDKNPDDVRLYVGCCLSDDTRGETDDLIKDGYTMCQRPSKDIFIRVGQRFYIEFSGNVQPRDEEGIEDSLWFTFHPRKRRNHIETSVKVLDTSQDPRTNVHFKWPSQGGQAQAAGGNTKPNMTKAETDGCFLTMQVCLPPAKLSLANQELLRKNRVEIVNNMQPQEVMDHLYQEFVIEFDELEEIRQQNTRSKQVGALLDKLPYKDDQDFGRFIQVLQKTKHKFLAALLQGKAKPDPPTGVKVTSESSKSLTVSWTPGSDGGCQQHFQITFCQKGSSIFAAPDLVKTPGVTSHEITGLQASTTYEVKVCGVNDLGPGEDQKAEGTTQAGPTMSKNNQDILSRNQDEVVQKMQPEEVIDYLIQHHVITAKEATEIRNSHSSRDPIVANVLDLLPFKGDRGFTVLLAALDDTNQPYLAALLRGAEKPDPPTKITVFAHHDSLDVSWMPGKDGGSEQHFEIAYHRKDQSSATTASSPVAVKAGATSHRIDSLQPKTTYTVRVRGVNVMGQGLYQETEVTTRAEPTMSKQCQQILDKHSGALVDRMQPQNVVDYLIQRNAIEATEKQSMENIDKSSKGVVRRLLECLPYHGDKAFNGLLSFLEETKQNYLSALLRGSLHVSWTPGPDGGSTQYFEIVYQKKEHGAALTTASSQTAEVKGEGVTEYLIDGLEPSTVYVVKVRGVNVLGPGEFQSQEAATKAGPNMSMEYQDLLKKARSEAAETMSLEGVISNLINTGVLEEAEEKILRGSRTSASEITCALLDLLPYKGDEGYRGLLTALEATNQNYLAAVFQGKEIPSPPTDVTLISTCYDSLNVSWTPGYDGGCEQYFEITYRDKDRGTDFITPPIEVKISNVNTYLIEDLQESTTYVVKVRGVNELGPGEYQTPEAEEITRGAPSHPDLLNVKKKTGTSLTMSWKPGRIDEGDPWEDYFLQYKEKSQGANFPYLAPIRVTPQLATEYTIGGLQPDTTYSIKLYAKSATKTSKSLNLHHAIVMLLRESLRENSGGSFLHFIGVVLVGIVGYSRAYPFGAPSAACQDLIPGHGKEVVSSRAYRLEVTDNWGNSVDGYIPGKALSTVQHSCMRSSSATLIGLKAAAGRMTYRPCVEDALCAIR
ncbi:Fibronectin type III domain-containing protein 3B [Branchiostoma belcheri]|nr:Fibronectin type III domain-containing protein 3B [Branchiostoma belcheri]